MNVLVNIDTTSNKEVIVSLVIDGNEIMHKKPLDTRKAQVVLPMLEMMLQKQQLTLQDLSEIMVNTGPGSFTGIRVGITIANTLGFLLNIPVNGHKAGDPVEANYF
ncbi:MAG: tRNA (adenosine(37)-N6)-threonylcarbamoyltransferase complex dimerization subunit type 1 TsaB [Candidatus Levyibacteriota bacterium]